MQCLGQYDLGFVQAEREGHLDDPTYIEGLKKDHPLRVRENVFAFSMACASQQLLQMLALALDPLGQSNPGEQLYHFVGGHMEPPMFGTCHAECLFPNLAAQGDHCRLVVTGPRPRRRGTATEAEIAEPTLQSLLGRVRGQTRAALSWFTALIKKKT
jgi:hypothetical protein